MKNFWTIMDYQIESIEIQTHETDLEIIKQILELVLLRLKDTSPNCMNASIGELE